MGRGSFGLCPCCGRICTLTFHHLIPVKVHRRAHFKKHYTKVELQRSIDVAADVTTAFMIALLKELAKEYNTLTSSSVIRVTKTFSMGRKQKVE